MYSRHSLRILTATNTAGRRRRCHDTRRRKHRTLQDRKLQKYSISNEIKRKILTIKEDNEEDNVAGHYL
jgi:hypothetical protein